MPSTEEIIEQVRALEGKALSYVKDAQAPVVDAVAKVAETLAGRLPEERPQAVAQGIDVLVGQVEFAKQVLEAQVDLVKAVLDAAVAPIKPAPVKKTVKAATAA